MQRLHHRTLFLTILLILAFGELFADQSQKLPDLFKPLVPPGYELRSPVGVKQGHMATLSFEANKPLQGRHSVYFSELHLDLMIKAAPNEAMRQMIQRQAPAYRAQYEQDVAAALEHRRQSGSDALTVYDPPESTQYDWGVGITQRVIHKFVGAGTGPDEIEYSCIYLGFTSDSNAIKKFKFSVSGVETRQEADRWATQAAEAIQRTSLNDIE
jgi:hypothetical protein